MQLPKKPVFGAFLSSSAALRKHQRLGNLQTSEIYLLIVQGFEGWEVQGRRPRRLHCLVRATWILRSCVQAANLVREDPWVFSHGGRQKEGERMRELKALCEVSFVSDLTLFS